MTPRKALHLRQERHDQKDVDRKKRNKVILSNPEEDDCVLNE